MAPLPVSGRGRGLGYPAKRGATLRRHSLDLVERKCQILTLPVALSECPDAAGSLCWTPLPYLRQVATDVRHSVGLPIRAGVPGPLLPPAPFPEGTANTLPPPRRCVEKHRLSLLSPAVPVPSQIPRAVPSGSFFGNGHEYAQAPTALVLPAFLPFPAPRLLRFPALPSGCSTPTLRADARSAAGSRGAPFGCLSTSVRFRRAGWEQEPDHAALGGTAFAAFSDPDQFQ
jgi:hypothetical protein